MRQNYFWLGVDQYLYIIHVKFAFVRSLPWSSMHSVPSLMHWRVYLWHWQKTLVCRQFTHWLKWKLARWRKTTLLLALTACWREQVVCMSWLTLLHVIPVHFVVLSPGDEALVIYHRDCCCW